MADVITANFTYNDFVAVDLVIDIGFFDQAEYQGLDPERTFQELIKKAAAAGKKKNEFIMEMERLLIFYVRRGTNTTRADFAARSKAGLPTTIQAIMTTYGIKPRLEGNAGPEVITIARVATVFPYIPAAFFATSLVDPVAWSKDFGLPKVFAFPQGPALMTDDEWKTYKKAWLDWSVAFTKIVNRGRDQLMNQNTNVAGAAQPTANATNVRSMDDATIRILQETFGTNAQASSFSVKNKTIWRDRTKNTTKNLAAAWKDTKGDDLVIDYAPM